jgi:Domain of unknown function (DUF5666)
MTRRRMPAIATSVALATALIVGVLATPAQAALRHIDGTVVSKNPDNRTFRIATQNGNRLQIKVNAATEFERLNGFGALHKGLRIEVDAQRTDNGLIARQIELRGGGGGDDNGGGGGGADDGPDHT